MNLNRKTAGILIALFTGVRIGELCGLQMKDISLTDKMRLFLTDAGYSKALENQEKGHIKIRNHAKVLSGNLHYDHKDRER